MTIAKIINGQPVALTPGEDVVTGDFVSSFESACLWDDEHLSTVGLYRIQDPEPADEGEEIVSTSLQVINGQVRRVAEYGSVTPPRRTIAKSEIIRRVHEAGVLAQVMAILDAPANTYAKARWLCPDRPAVYTDDADLVAVLTAAGANPAAITA